MLKCANRNTIYFGIFNLENHDIHPFLQVCPNRSCHWLHLQCSWKSTDTGKHGQWSVPRSATTMVINLCFSSSDDTLLKNHPQEAPCKSNSPHSQTGSPASTHTQAPGSILFSSWRSSFTSRRSPFENPLSPCCHVPSRISRWSPCICVPVFSVRREWTCLH